MGTWEEIQSGLRESGVYKGPLPRVPHLNHQPPFGPMLVFCCLKSVTDIRSVYADVGK